MKPISASGSPVGWVWRSQGVVLGWEGLEVPIGPVFPTWHRTLGLDHCLPWGILCTVGCWPASRPLPTRCQWLPSVVTTKKSLQMRQNVPGGKIPPTPYHWRAHDHGPIAEPPEGSMKRQAKYPKTPGPSASIWGGGPDSIVLNTPRILVTDL